MSPEQKNTICVKIPIVESNDEGDNTTNVDDDEDNDSIDDNETIDDEPARRIEQQNYIIVDHNVRNDDPTTCFDISLALPLDVDSYISIS
ncbi:unnamed protein product [Didymodactylos carnosus]|uniref:Uncharacterized protein n=1 Tax=Didymodactylos carnosus TaxID=1234261 RepID=A0A814K329_9BILA|nr:unnamed protein product [Didymodactylos carnosus]CAF1073484.1 unnamed protein product [Didymodactylos carnosus]CAF3815900.1 unnamed protein product [Didymodactylos carnosus]CAF3837530.1 unnamed protein product [Didymodactylos carnosus]